MDNNKLHDKFRKQLTIVHALTALTVLLFEIIGYTVLICTEHEQLRWNSPLLWFRLLIPSGINALTHLATRLFINTSNASPKAKNAAITAALLITAFVVAVFHRKYLVACCTFVFPIILSALFNNKKLLTGCFVSSLIILAAVAIFWHLDGMTNLTFVLNLLVLFGFSLISFLCGITTIRFSKLNASIIKSQEQKNNQLREDLLRDQMTGLYGHQTFLTHLDVLTQSTDSGTYFCLAMLDLDDFKKVNDTYGHDCGDEVLLFLAKALQRHCEITDIPYRYGGEEFAIIFRDKSIREVQTVMESMLIYFRAHCFSFTDKPVTFSAGISQYVPGMMGKALFEAADHTLYAAKKAGKNCILIDSAYIEKTGVVK